LPGEQVTWHLQRRQRNFDEGRLGEVLRASPDRVVPRCPHFGVCGGCVLQHLSASRQLDAKQAQLFEALTRIGRVAPEETLPPLTADDAWNYRRRARLSAKWVAKKNRVVVGFRERAAPFVRTCARAMCCTRRWADCSSRCRPSSAHSRFAIASRRSKWLPPTTHSRSSYEFSLSPTRRISTTCASSLRTSDAALSSAGWLRHARAARARGRTAV